MKCTRREWLGLGLGAGAAVFGGRWNLSFAGERTYGGPVNMAVIPSSGEQVPAVGLGTVKFQGNPDSDDLSQLRRSSQAVPKLIAEGANRWSPGEKRRRFDDALAEAMRREVTEFFNHIVREDRPLTDLLDSDYTFVNRRLAELFQRPVEGYRVASLLSLPV